MKLLRPTPTGTVNHSKPPISAGIFQHYTKPTTVLRHIDALRQGAAPEICIMRKTGGIGDVLMTLPTVREISCRYGTPVTYATDPSYLDGALIKVLQGNPYIKEVVSWNEIDPGDYSGTVELTCPCIAHEIPHAPPINRIDLFARHAGLLWPLANPSIDYCVTPAEHAWAHDYLAAFRPRKLVLVQPSSSTLRRDLPRAKLLGAIGTLLAIRKDTVCIVLTHNSDHLIGEWNINNVHLAHNLDVRQIAALIEQVDLVLCPDSAILHLASALHQKTVTWFGPTDPRARVNYHPEAVALWPAQHLPAYPTWYKDINDGLLCWRVFDESLIVTTSLAMLAETSLPRSKDYVTFGNYAVQP